MVTVRFPCCTHRGKWGSNEASLLTKMQQQLQLSQLLFPPPASGACIQLHVHYSTSVKHHSQLQTAVRIGSVSSAGPDCRWLCPTPSTSGCSTFYGYTASNSMQLCTCQGGHPAAGSVLAKHHRTDSSTYSVPPYSHLSPVLAIRHHPNQPQTITLYMCSVWPAEGAPATTTHRCSSSGTNDSSHRGPAVK